MADIQPAPSKAPKIIGFEEVTCKCGHPVNFDLFEKDPFRDRRREKVTSRACPTCRQEQHKADAERAKANKAKPKPSKYGPEQRLPHGSKFRLAYDGEAVMWTGSLEVPVGDRWQVFNGTGSSLFGLERHLDMKYRTWLERGKEENSVDAAKAPG